MATVQLVTMCQVNTITTHTEVEKQPALGDLGKALNDQVTSNTSNVPSDIPQFTAGNGDSVGGEVLSGATESSKNPQSADE